MSEDEAAGQVSRINEAQAAIIEAGWRGLEAGARIHVPSWGVKPRHEMSELSQRFFESIFIEVAAEVGKLVFGPENRFVRLYLGIAGDEASRDPHAAGLG